MICPEGKLINLQKILFNWLFIAHLQKNGFIVIVKLITAFIKCHRYFQIKVLKIK